MVILYFMIRLREININTPEKAFEIFENRWKKELHYIDWGRFKQLALFYKGGKYLDLGCFNSPMPLELKRDFPKEEIWAMDHCEKLIKILRKRHQEINYIVGDAMNPPFDDEYFDYIVAGEIMEHLEDPAAFIRGAMRILKKDGMIALSVPKDEGMGGDPVSNEHLWGFNEQDLKDLLSPYGNAKIGIWEDTIKSYIAYCKKI